MFFFLLLIEFILFNIELLFTGVFNIFWESELTLFLLYKVLFGFDIRHIFDLIILFFVGLFILFEFVSLEVFGIILVYSDDDVVEEIIFLWVFLLKILLLLFKLPLFFFCAKFEFFILLTWILCLILSVCKPSTLLKIISLWINALILLLKYL